MNSIVAILRTAKRMVLFYWRVEAAEQARIAEALDKRRREAARHELHELRIQIKRLEALLAAAGSA